MFVLTADHTNLSEVAEYQTSLGGFRVPIVFYDPSGEMPRGMREGIAQQVDIMPTILGYLGYEKPYVAFGCDLFHTPAEDTWAVNYLNGIYQYVKGDYLIQFDGKDVKAIYRFKEDLLLENNLVGKVDCSDLVDELKAVIQSYMTRMNNNQLVLSD